jgi:3-methylfumaryl-CoA hydratase
MEGMPLASILGTDSSEVSMLLADLVRRHTPRPIASFAFRGIAPLFDLAPFHLRGRSTDDTVALEALAPDLTPALSAQVELAPPV